MSTTWDDGVPQDRPRDDLDRLIDKTMEQEPRIVTIATVGYDEDGDPIRRVVATKPPLDPITAGWVMCACRCHLSEWVTMDHRHDQCPTCDGLGIVVGPPEDGLEIAAKVRAQDTRWPIAVTSSTYDLIRGANAWKPEDSTTVVRGEAR